MSNNNQPPKINFSKVARKKVKESMVYLDRFSDSYLFAELDYCVEEENYETAIIYRDELIKRGRLLLKK